MSAFRATFNAIVTSFARSSGLSDSETSRVLRGNVPVTMAIQHGTESERILEARSRYVARGVAVSPVVVDRAEGARIWDVDGRSYIDFAGGIGCQNTGHNFPTAVAAIPEQVDPYLHQFFMVTRSTA